MASYNEKDLRKSLTRSGAACWALEFAARRLSAHKLLTDEVRECLRASSWAMAVTDGPDDEAALKAQGLVLDDMMANSNKQCEDCEDVKAAAVQAMEKRALLLGDFGRTQ